MNNEIRLKDLDLRIIMYLNLLSEIFDSTEVTKIFSSFSSETNKQKNLAVCFRSELKLLEANCDLPVFGVETKITYTNYI